MGKIKELFEKYRELIMYIFFGVLTFVVSVISFELFNRLLGSGAYMISKTLSWIVAVLFAYVVNKLWVFQSKSWKPSLVAREASSFFAARIFSLIIALGAMWVMVRILNAVMSDEPLFGFLSVESIANICSTALEVIINYIFSKLWVFKKKS